MKIRILSYLLGWVFAVLLGMWWLWWNFVNAEKCWGSDLPSWMYCCEGVPVNIPCDSVVVTWCNWIKLNTDFPILWDCIHLKEWEGWVDGTTALPYMIWALMKIIMSIIMVICFIIIIIAWIKRASNDPKTARDLIKKVAITILLLWLSGIILKVVNPLFFA